MTKHSYFPKTSTYCSTRHILNRKHNIHHILYTNIQHTLTLQGSKTLSTTTAATQQTFPQTHRLTHSHYNRHKKQTGAIYICTSIVSRHQATRGNNKILRIPPPHSSSEEILSRRTSRTITQLRTNKSPSFKSCLNKVDAKSHPSSQENLADGLQAGLSKSLQ